MIKSPFPVYELQDGEYVRAIDSDSEEGRNILLSGKGVLYIGITDAEGTEVSDMDILSVLRSLMELFGSERQYEHLAEPVAWHLRNFEDGSD